MLRGLTGAAWVRGLLVFGFSLGICLAASGGCQENGKATPSTTKQTTGAKATPKSVAKPAPAPAPVKPPPAKSRVSSGAH